jgi:hypothetical protein
MGWNKLEIFLADSPAVLLCLDSTLVVQLKVFWMKDRKAAIV